MKTLRHLWEHLAEFFLKWEIVRIKIAEKIKIHILYSTTFFLSSSHLWEDVERCGGGGPETPQMTTWRRVACWINKATRAQAYARARTATTTTHTHTHTHNASQRHIACTLPLLLLIRALLLCLCSTQETIHSFEINLSWTLWYDCENDFSSSGRKSKRHRKSRWFGIPNVPNWLIW